MFIFWDEANILRFENICKKKLELNHCTVLLSTLFILAYTALLGGVKITQIHVFIRRISSSHYIIQNMNF